MIVKTDHDRVRFCNDNGLRCTVDGSRGAARWRGIIGRDIRIVGLTR
jgi:hypothetical protein